WSLRKIRIHFQLFLVPLPNLTMIYSLAQQIEQELTCHLLLHILQLLCLEKGQTPFVLYFLM
ncbi:hypothetical protein D1339_25710, partial [Salmonella enterica subsp. enterica serovar Dublin]|nr:hypothetical protein [Salmonella enterica subsp. enterica serovar Dublin]